MEGDENKSIPPGIPRLFPGTHFGRFTRVAREVLAREA
jgi:hypothetical protein